MRWERRGSGGADAPEHLPGTLTCVWLPPLQGVGEQIEESERLPDGNRGPDALAGAHAKHTGESLEEALKVVLRTEAGQRLTQVRDGVHRGKRADQW